MPKIPLLLAMGLLICSCQRQTNDPPPPPSRTTVAAVAVKKQAIERTLKLVAEFRPYREIDVMAKVSGYVNRINVDMGDRVAAGQVIATLEVPEMADDQTRARAAIERSAADIARAREEVRRADGALQLAQLNADRLQNVAKQRPGLIAQQELDAVKTRAFELSAQLAASKSALASAEQGGKVLRAEESRVNTLVNYTRVVAPFGGVITRRFAEIGSMVQAGINSQTNVLPLVRLAQDNMLRLELPIPESAVPFVRVGFPVTIQVRTLDREVQGKIDRFSNQLQTSTRTMTAQVDVTNTGLEIKPGMFAEVLFRLESKHDALVAPLMTLDGAGDTRRALRVLPDGKVTPVTVTVGSETSEGAEITAGLAAGDVLVLSGRAQLQAGQVVTPKMVEGGK